MHLSPRRVFDEKRRFVIPIVAGLALNILVLAGIVYPLGVRVRSTEAPRRRGRATAAERGARRRRRAGRRRAPRSHGQGVEGFLQGRAPVESRTGTTGDVPSIDAARRAAQPRTCTAQHRSQAGERLVARARADLDDAAGRLSGHPALHLSGRVRRRFHRHRQHFLAAGDRGRTRR